MPSIENALQALDFGTWSPPGSFDEEAEIWRLEGQVANRFPESGIDVFASVDRDSYWFRHRNRVICRLVDRFSPQTSFLEIGAGSGVVSAYLSSRGRVVATVEPVEAGARRAAQRGIAASFCGDLASMQLPSNVVPSAGMFDVIEHLEEPSGVLAETHRVLQSGGVLTVTVPAYSFLWSDVDEWNGHYRRYSRSSLVSGLREAGFAVECISHIFAPLLLPALVSRRLSSSKTDRSLEEIETAVARGLRPSRLVNSAMLLAHLPEVAAVGRVPIPFGTSLVAVARKDGPPPR